MWYDFDFNEYYYDGLGEVSFTNLKTNKETNKDYSYVYWGNKTYNIPIYDCNDLILKNGTITKKCIQNGTENKNYETWLPYNSKDIPDNKIE